MISYVLEAASCGKDVIRVLSDDTDVFVLLIYWLFRRQLKCKIQMERWDRTVLDINATCTNLGPKCLQLLGMRALSGCDTTSHPFGKGKATALKTWLVGDYHGLANVLGEVGATTEDLIEAAGSYFIALYGQSPGTSLQSACFQLFASKIKVLKSWLYHRHHPTCCTMCFEPIFRSYTGRQQTNIRLPQSRLILLVLGGNSRMTFPFQSLITVTQLLLNWSI